MSRTAVPARLVGLVRGRPVVSALVAVVVVVAAVTAVAAVRSIDHSPRAGVGEVWLDSAVQPSATPAASVRVPLPDGFVLLTVGEPRERLLDGYDELGLDDRSDDLEEPESLVRAPDGGVLVPIGLAADPDAPVPTSPPFGLTPAPEVALDAVPDPTVVVEAGGEEVDLGTRLSEILSLQETSTPMVALPGDGTSFTVRITFDGEVQEVDVEDGEVVEHRLGRFAAYAADDEVGEALGVPVEPGDGFTVGGYDPTAGGLDVERAVRVPWVSGLGWAEEGEGWVAVDLVVTQPIEVVRDGRPFPGLLRPDFSTATYRLGSTPAAAVLAVDVPGSLGLGGAAALAVFAGPESGPLDDVDVDVDLPFDASQVDPTPTGPASVPVSWTVPLPVED